jgi:3-phosphoshikimate 1-carboxyvinyltransferase
MEINIATIGQLQAEVSVPGSKSYTQRALVTAALASGPSRLRNVLFSEDTDQFIQALTALGVSVSRDGQDLLIEGTNGRLSLPDAPIYLGNNGTAMRFLISLVSMGKGSVVLTGDRRLCERPIKPLMTYLETLGVSYRYLGNYGFPPVQILGSGLRGGTLAIRNTESSQYISSLLLAAPYAEADVCINLEGEIASRPYIDLTLQVMHDFGVKVDEGMPGSYRISCRTGYRGRDYVIEGDASSASYFFLAAMLCQGTVRVHNINPQSRQGDLKILDYFQDMGVNITWGDSWVNVQGGDVKTVDRIIDMGDMPDMVPTMAVLSAFHKGTTKITRVAHLRIKESNRLAALITELNKIGAIAHEDGDSLVISGGNLHGGMIETYNDHRIAMSFAIAGLVVPGITIQNPRCVDKSFPGFWDELKKLG